MWFHCINFSNTNFDREEVGIQCIQVYASGGLNYHVFHNHQKAEAHLLDNSQDRSIEASRKKNGHQGIDVLWNRQNDASFEGDGHEGQEQERCSACHDGMEDASQGIGARLMMNACSVIGAHLAVDAAKGMKVAGELACWVSDHTPIMAWDHCIVADTNHDAADHAVEDILAPPAVSA